MKAAAESSGDRVRESFVGLHGRAHNATRLRTLDMLLHMMHHGYRNDEGDGRNHLV
jgi:hypothetical protein